MLEAVACTDVGIQRKINEDHCVAHDRHGLFVVCDGMGGHAGGEVASRLGSESIVNFILASRAGKVPTLPFPLDPALPLECNRLAMAIRVANRTIYDAAQRNTGLRGMGSTVAAMMVVEPLVYFAHVGDSRVYRYRQEKLEALTRDHSELNHLIDTGRLRPEDAEKHPDKNVITRALGVDPDVEVTTRAEKLRDGDMYVLCSDGVTDLVSDRKIVEVMRNAYQQSMSGPRTNLHLDWVGQELIRLANRAGGKDNITAVVVRYSA